MTPNKAAVLKAIAPVLNKTYADRETLEDAFYPLFGALQIYFQGEGHRDLVDRLIGAKWIVRKNNGYLVTVPEEEVAAPTPKVETSTNDEQITFAELELIVEIGAARNGVAVNSFNQQSIPKVVIQPLIDREIVFIGSQMPDDKKAAAQKSLNDAILRVRHALDTMNLEEARSALAVAIDTKTFEQTYDVPAYHLTSKGIEILNKIQALNIKV